MQNQSPSGYRARVEQHWNNQTEIPQKWKLCTKWLSCIPPSESKCHQLCWFLFRNRTIIPNENYVYLLENVQSINMSRGWTKVETSIIQRCAISWTIFALMFPYLFGCCVLLENCQIIWLWWNLTKLLLASEKIDGTERIMNKPGECIPLKYTVNHVQLEFLVYKNSTKIQLISNNINKLWSKIEGMIWEFVPKTHLWQWHSSIHVQIFGDDTYIKEKKHIYSYSVRWLCIYAFRSAHVICPKRLVIHSIEAWRLRLLLLLLSSSRSRGVNSWINIWMIITKKISLSAVLSIFGLWGRMWTDWQKHPERTAMHSEVTCKLRFC